MTPKKKVLALGVLVLLLAASFWYGGGAPGLQGWQISSSSGVSSSSSPTDTSADQSLPPEASLPQTPDDSAVPAQSDSQDASSHGESSALSPQPEPAPSGSSPVSQEEPPTRPQDPQPAQEPLPPEELACTVSIRCDTVLDHMDWLDPNKAELIPADGVILADTQAPFEEGETAFDLLQRLTRQEGIHMEASFTPGYNSSYVEGIANLYEFDCGQQSGWLYLVNGVSPGYSSSQYTLSDGDRVEWVYTCDLGQDVGAAQ